MTQNHSGPYNLGDIMQLPAHGERSAIVDLRDESRARQLTAFELGALCDAVGRGLLRRGIRPGAQLEVSGRNYDQTLTLATSAGTVALGRSAAIRVWVLPSERKSRKNQ